MVAAQLSLALSVAVAYGFVGFWLLDRREFGIDFNWLQSLEQTLRCLAFRADTAFQPHTRYARWFIDSLYLISTTSLTYATFSVFQPVIYHLSIEPQERMRAARIVEKYGTRCQDYFKFWPDKSFYFSQSGESFLSYRVASGLAVVLGDPVAAPHEAASIIRQFSEFCRHNGWSLVFYQTRPEFIEVYRALGFKKLKIGDNAVVDLQTFTLEGRTHRTLRSGIHRLEKAGIHVVRYQPPTPANILDQAKEVSNDWLNIPGRRERGFAVGPFDRDYIRSTALYAAFDASERMLGFMNTVPSLRTDETTIDLMRRRADSPNGIMDYLFVKILLDRKAEKFKHFDLGMAPMAGFREHEQASPEERAVHYFFQHLNFVFSFAGLYAYKAKFASFWEPRYIVYRNVFDLPRVVVALGRVSSIASEAA
jgi:phosphatidylglycerol lysyltransferase